MPGRLLQFQVIFKLFFFIWLTPQGQLSNFWTFFPFGLKWKPLLRRHVIISVKSFSLKIKIMSCSFVKIIYIINIFYQLRAVNEYKSEVWKGKIPCPWGVNSKKGILKKCGIFRFISRLHSKMIKRPNSRRKETYFRNKILL